MTTDHCDKFRFSSHVHAVQARNNLYRRNKKARHRKRRRDNQLINKQTVQKIRIYHCTLCGGYHLGHQGSWEHRHGADQDTQS